MQKILMFSVLSLIAAGFTGCVWMKSQPDVNEIIAKVKQKNDPRNKAETVSSAILKYSCVNKAEKSNIVILLKRPDKLKIINHGGDFFWQCAFDGKQAWEYTNSKGVRLLTGAEYNEVRLQASLLAPSINIKKVFKDIKLVGSAEIGGQACWKLICQPADIFKSQPIVVFVTKETSLIARTIEKQDAENEVIEVITSFKDYKSFEGFLLPVKTITKIDDELTESTLESVILNKKIPDSVFVAPAEFK